MNKTILLTGATDGIGKLLAYKLAHEGHILYLHGRNEQKLKDMISDIQKEADNSQVFPCTADFSKLDSVKTMSQDILKKVNSLDVLINNAGIYNSPIDINEDGYDIRFVVNYFAPYILTNSLIPVLKQSSNPRVINLSSAAQAPVSGEALDGKLLLPAGEAYAQSKLALTMWSFNFAKNHSDINTIAVNPGSLLNTKMAQEAFGQHWSSADKGRDILYDLALSDEYQNESGKYFDNDRGDFGRAHQDAYDDKKISELISFTERII